MGGMPATPGIVAAAAQLPALAGAMTVPAAAKSAWNFIAPHVGGNAATAIGNKLGLPWWLTYPLGSAVGGKATFGKGSAPAPAPKPWGQRPAPVAGSKPYGPSNAAPTRGPVNGPPAAPSGPSTPPNLIRQGNVTNPGPNGTGSPSTPSGPTPGLGTPPKWKGPMGDEGNWNPVKPNSTAKQSPIPSFDEADKRKVMFGGIQQVDGSGKATPPSKRTPIGLRKPKDKK